MMLQDVTKIQFGRTLIIQIFPSVFFVNHGRSQDFSKGGSHSVKQRVLAFS